MEIMIIILKMIPYLKGMPQRLRDLPLKNWNKRTEIVLKGVKMVRGGSSKKYFSRMGNVLRWSSHDFSFLVFLRSFPCNTHPFFPGKKNDVSSGQKIVEQNFQLEIDLQRHLQKSPLSYLYLHTKDSVHWVRFPAILMHQNGTDKSTKFKWALNISWSRHTMVICN